MTLEQAKVLKAGQVLHHVIHKNKDGSPQRWRVTSVKTWKTRPEQVLVKVKWGLKTYDQLTELDLELVSLP